MYNDLFSVGPLTVHTYGLCIGIGIAAALLLIWRRAERRGMDTQDVNRLVLLVLVTGFAGAKLFYLFAHMDEFLSDPLGTLGAEGFVVYGGIVCGLLAAYLFCRKRSLPFSVWADGFIPGVAVAQGFGRIGCFFAGCCAALLLLLDRKKPRAGLLTGLYLLLYSIGRFLIEFLRSDPRGAVGALSTSQFIALFTAAAAIVLLISRKRGKTHG